MLPETTASDQSLRLIACHAEEGARLRERFFHDMAVPLCRAAHLMAVRLAAGNRLLLCGSGDGSIIARRMAHALIGRFQLNRPALPALLLDADTAFLSGLPGEGDSQQALARQVDALGTPGDILLLVSTAGDNDGLLYATEAARLRGMHVLAMTARQEGNDPLLPRCDVLLAVPHAAAPLVLEVHMAAGHLLCRLVDHYLFENPNALRAVPAGVSK